VLDEAALVGEVETDVVEEGENALERLNSLHF
jgi:hypothetical protein